MKKIFLKNNKILDIKSGQTGYITNIDDDKVLSIKMDNGKKLNINPLTEYNYLSYGYTLTSYKSQGQTAKQVIYHADAQKGTTFNQVYVGIMRGRENIKLYCDNIELLKDMTMNEQVKASTLDYEEAMLYALQKIDKKLESINL